MSSKVEANEVFAIFPREHIARPQELCYFDVWVEATTEARLVTSFDTTEDEIMAFVRNVRTCVNQ